MRISKVFFLGIVFFSASASARPVGTVLSQPLSEVTSTTNQLEVPLQQYVDPTPQAPSLYQVTTPAPSQQLLKLPEPEPWEPLCGGRAIEPGMSCCGGELYNPRKDFCCADVKLKVGESCCAGVKYENETASCCAGEVKQKIDGQINCGRKCTGNIHFYKGVYTSDGTTPTECSNYIYSPLPSADQCGCANVKGCLFVNVTMDPITRTPVEVAPPEVTSMPCSEDLFKR